MTMEREEALMLQPAAAQSTVSAHLACLLDCGLVTARPAGRATIWSALDTGELLDTSRQS